MTARMAARVRELTDARVPFVHATVVRAQVPTSVRPGDDAVVLADGSIEGFVGGVCAEGSVRTAALDSLAAGTSLLLRVLPDSEQNFPDAPGAAVVVNPCLSGGAMEIFLEPVLPRPLVEVVGNTPVAEAVVSISAVLGYATARSGPGNGSDRAVAVVIASHGRDEHEAITAALAAGVPYIALVASPRRGRAVLDELDLSSEQRARISTPAGLDIGARTAPEVALSILAEVITAVRSRAATTEPTAEPAAEPAGVPDARPGPGSGPSVVVDPVCGMRVTVMPDTAHLLVDGTDFWFCSEHCRHTYAGR